MSVPSLRASNMIVVTHCQSDPGWLDGPDARSTTALGCSMCRGYSVQAHLPAMARGGAAYERAYLTNWDRRVASADISSDSSVSGAARG
jgi:hypothetical protein